MIGVTLHKKLSGVHYEMPKRNPPPHKGEGIYLFS